MSENQEIQTKKPIQKLIQIFTERGKNDSNIAKIKVSDMISKVAFFYEKIRNIVDYREEYLLRKGAVERIIKRKLLIEGKLAIEPQKEIDIAQSLIFELIRGVYLPNNAIPETKIEEVANILIKYAALKKKLNKQYGYKQIKKTHKWLISLMACEIEEKLVPPTREKALADTMYKLMNPLIIFEGKETIDEQEKNTQIYLAVYRNLLKYDPILIDYLLLKLYWPEWPQADDKYLEQIATNIKNTRQAIEAQKKHKLRDKLNKIFKKYSFVFIVLRDVINNNPDNIENVLRNPKLLEEKINKVCNKTYKDTKIKLRRSIGRSIAYIFITKMALALAIEVPFDLYVAHQLHYLSLGINILFHPLLLLFIALTTRIPEEKNTKIVTNSLKMIIYEQPETQVKYRVKLPAKRGGILQAVFTLIYALTFVISFGILIYILNKLQFSILSMLLFVFFLSIVSFFATRIRKSIKEIIVVKKKENIFTALADFFFTPIVHAGHWLSVNFSKINLFVFIMDMIIEAPFKLIIDVSEQWFAFVKEKKEELEP